MDDKTFINVIVNMMVFIMFGYAIYVDLKSNPHLKYKFSWRCKRAAVWVVMGLNYAVQVGTRYSLTTFNTDEGRAQINITTSMFGILTSVSLWVYAFAMLFNGVLIDKYGGRIVYCVGMVIHTVVNLSFGIYCHFMWQKASSLPDSALPFVAFYYSATNYLQTLGALVPMKVTTNWYRKEERGVISGLYGICLAAGYLISFAGNGAIYTYFPPEYVFIISGIILFMLTIATFAFLYNSPEEYGIPEEDNEILREVDASSGASQQAGLYNPPADDFLSIVTAIPLTMWLNGVGMLICGGVREGFFAFISDYIDSKYGEPPGSILQAFSGASITIGSAASAFFVSFINSYTEDNVALGGVLYFIILTLSMIFFTISKSEILVVIFVGFASLAMFAIAGLRRKLSMDYGGVKRGAFVTGFLGSQQFLGGGIGSMVCAVLISRFGYYLTFFGSIFSYFFAFYS